MTYIPWIIEALACDRYGMSEQEIATMVGLTLPVIQTYLQCFFDIARHTEESGSFDIYVTRVSHARSNGGVYDYQAKSLARARGKDAYIAMYLSTVAAEDKITLIEDSAVMIFAVKVAQSLAGIGSVSLSQIEASTISMRERAVTVAETRVTASDGGDGIKDFEAYQDSSNGMFDSMICTSKEVLRKTLNDRAGEDAIEYMKTQSMSVHDTIMANMNASQARHQKKALAGSIDTV